MTIFGLLCRFRYAALMCNLLDAATVRSTGRLAYGALVALLVVFATPPMADAGVRLVRVWTHDAGGKARAEIVVFDADARELLVTNGDQQRITRLDLRRGCEVGRYDVSAFGAPTSVAASHGLVAVAVPAANQTDPGHVLLFRSVRGHGTSSKPLAVVQVGSLPDMITFTADGRNILVANEGEPSDDYKIDPAGSVGIIDLSRGPAQAVVRVADFAAFEAVRPELEQFGVRLVARGATTPTAARRSTRTSNPSTSRSHPTVGPRGSRCRKTMPWRRSTCRTPLSRRSSGWV